MSAETKLVALLAAGQSADLMTLARTRGTTAKLLGQFAVRQFLAAARNGLMPVSPASDAGHPFAVWLGEADRTALAALATEQDTTPAHLAFVAIDRLLEQARKGALPMLKPAQPAEEPEPRSLEELYARANLWDAKYLNDPDDLPEEVPHRPYRTNMKKAQFILERLERLDKEGLDPANPRAVLNDIDKLVTVRP